MNLFVSNIPFKATPKDLENLFSDFGEVGSCKIINDRETGRSRGFGFVEMPNGHEAERAIKSLNNFEWMGRTLVVKPAEPKKG